MKSKKYYVIENQTKIECVLNRITKMEPPSYFFMVKDQENTQLLITKVNEIWDFTNYESDVSKLHWGKQLGKQIDEGT